jgi:hypothetical protein
MILRATSKAEGNEKRNKGEKLSHGMSISSESGNVQVVACNNMEDSGTVERLGLALSKNEKCILADS